MQGKIHPIPHKEIVKILQKNGFILIKGSGKHLKFRKTTENEVLTTFVSHRPVIQPQTIRYIIMQSKKPEEEFY
jgi:predicted RNA binding protein YcfA (HicA-like mRNA interferase family)